MGGREEATGTAADCHGEQASQAAGAGKPHQKHPEGVYCIGVWRGPENHPVLCHSGFVC